MEELEREAAAAEFRKVLSRVSDLELGLFVMARQGADASPEEAEAAVLAALEEAWPLVLKATGHREDMPEEEARRRMFAAIVEPIIYTRKTGVLRALELREREKNQPPRERNG